MDLTDPTRAITGTLDGPVLAVLATSGKPLTVGEIARQTARGSEIGVRKSLARLVEQGIVRATEMGRNRVHELNRDHVAAPIAQKLADLRLDLWKRFRAEFSTWKPRPVHSCVFGSAARGDGDSESDIDLLLVRPPVRGEKDTRPKRAAADAFLPTGWEPMTDRAAQAWEENVERLRESARNWSGNPLQPVEMSVYEWADHQRRGTALATEIERDAVDVGPRPIRRPQRPT